MMMRKSTCGKLLRELKNGGTLVRGLYGSSL